MIELIVVLDGCKGTCKCTTYTSITNSKTNEQTYACFMGMTGKEEYVNKLCDINYYYKHYYKNKC